jgi:hypothetical protein
MNLPSKQLRSHELADITGTSRIASELPVPRPQFVAGLPIRNSH